MARDQLRRAGDDCAVIASDALAGASSLSWYLDNGVDSAVCRDIDGYDVPVRDLHLVWWRRMPRGAAVDNRGHTPDAVEIFTARNIRASLLGIFLTDFQDWRHPLDADIEPYALSMEVRDALLGILAEFGLQMGIFDLKLTNDGEPVWLELNPQGQFLFVEAMGGGDLMTPFVRFVQGI